MLGRIFLSPEKISKEFGIPMHTAKEIIDHEVQHALRTRWQAWAFLISSVAFASWSLFFSDVKFMAVPLLISTMVGWRFIGSQLAETAIRRSARDKADRLMAKHA